MSTMRDLRCASVGNAAAPPPAPGALSGMLALTWSLTRVVRLTPPLVSSLPPPPVPRHILLPPPLNSLNEQGGGGGLASVGDMLEGMAAKQGVIQAALKAQLDLLAAFRSQLAAAERAAPPAN